MLRRALSFFGLIFIAACSFSQEGPIEQYIKNDDYKAAVALDPAKRTQQDITKILPNRKTELFAEYVAAKSSAVNLFTLRQAVEKLRLNKQVASPSGSTGVTSLVSRVAVPGIVGLGVEYGSILQRTTGNSTTLRGNLLGVARMLFGAQQFPNCSLLTKPKDCEPASRWLRRFSAVGVFENVDQTIATGTAVPANSTTPTVVDLFGNGYHMASWGARFDITANDPSDPKYLTNWKDAITKLRGDQAGLDLTDAVGKLITPEKDTYSKWQVETVDILKSASKSEFKQRLEQRLDILIDRLMASDADFVSKVAAVRLASQNYFAVRDELLQAIQSHKFSVEYNNQHPRNQPTASNVRIIYSHQPGKSPTLITINAAATWYNSLPAAPATSRLRDVQAAGQLERRLGEVPNLGNAVMTFAGYYQWMKEDALITIGPGNVAPGSGIVLPGTAAKLLGTKGNIGIIQGKLTLPMTTMIKVPLSVTWSNRTELIKESDTRGQVGVTFDLDSLFK